MQQVSKPLNTSDHSRDKVGLTYVYPVVSRRAGGVSIGINLNPNNACNWRCIYCQVPDLTRGAAPPIILEKLEIELRGFLQELVCGNFMQTQVPPEARTIKDIALSGNGEPTSAKEFEQVIELIGRVKKEFPLPENLKLVLITNGSLINRPHVLAGLKQMACLNGEVWFKLDSATREGRLRINNTRMSLRQVRENISLSASACPTWLQTCVFNLDAQPPSEKETAAYLKFADSLLQEGVPLKGVLVYGIIRPSFQPESESLSRVDKTWFDLFCNRIRKLGLEVKPNY
ncbi:Radical SAM superfamily protein [Nitrosomonas aestuarii]|uniref:Radical SAM superfamily protein n=1 Tax=Nitrosomonas aestuarii TaxID=52441 RepID=A0A1I4GJC4_9PROT|nr:radical SAM protein [Nitrosomonas aestuarii]SFL30174.1 Radical SAM superfamily protein [Nitrosomonas aestuarii]